MKIINRKPSKKKTRFLTSSWNPKDTKYSRHTAQLSSTCHLSRLDSHRLDSRGGKKNQEKEGIELETTIGTKTLFFSAP